MAEQHGLFDSPKKLIVVIVLAFLIPITLAVMVAQLATSGRRGTAESEEAVLRRIQPVARVVVSGTSTGGQAGAQAAAPAEPQPQAQAAAPAPQAAAPAPAGPAAAGAGAGKAVYDANCAACHATGAAGAPKLGDKSAWAPRLATGVDNLVTSAIKGKGVMPPKGGNVSLSDADVKAAVEFMVSQAK